MTPPHLTKKHYLQNMPASTKTSYIKIQKILAAWKALRANKAFAGLTLDQFIQAIMPCETTRATIARLENEQTAAQNQRDEADAAGMALALRVVSAVKADIEEGEDGELYEAMGYVRKSERKSGLSRKAKATVTNTKA